MSDQCVTKLFSLKANKLLNLNVLPCVVSNRYYLLSKSFYMVHSVGKRLYIEVEARLVSFVTKEGEVVIVRPVVFFNPFATDFLNTVA